MICDDDENFTYVPAPTRMDWLACAIVLLVVLPLAVLLGIEVAG